MNPKIIRHFCMALFICFTFIACNSNEKKAEESTPADNTATATAEAAKPAATEETIDAVKVAPDLYKMVSDTLGLRVLIATYKPGDSSVMHSHPNNAMYVISGGTAEFAGKDGTKQVSELKTGMSDVRSNDLHSVKNIGKTTLKVLLVEVNRPKEIVAPDAATDATKVAPANYKLVKDTMGIRILEVNYKPGQSAAFHSHPDYAMYVAEGGSTEITDKDGKVIKAIVKSGDASIRAADAHSGKNSGNKSFKLIMFEVNRPRN